MNPAANQRDNEDFEEKLWAFHQQGALPSTFADEEFLRDIGLFAQVEGALEQSGWKRLLDISCDTNVEDTFEFLASLEKTGKYLRYRHRGVYYEVTGRHLKNAFGWTTGATDEQDQHDADAAWSALTWSDRKFRPGRSLGSEIREPVYYYLHRLFSHTVLARHHGSQRLGVLDMGIMKGLVFGFKVKFGLALVEHWMKIRPTGKVTAGGMITYFLRAMHGTDHLEDQTVIKADYLTQEKMIKMKGIRETEWGLEWCYEGYMVMPLGGGVPLAEDDEEAHEAAQAGWVPSPARPRRTRAAVRDQAESSARTRNTRGRQAARAERAQTEEVARTEYPWMDPEYQRRWMFNSERVMDYYTPDHVDRNIEPPSDWSPGMPIPFDLRINDDEPETSNSPTF